MNRPWKLWLRRLAGRVPRHPYRRHARPAVERLEARATPASVSLGFAFDGSISALVFKAGPNEINRLTVRMVDGAYQLTDAGNTITVDISDNQQLGFTGSGTSTISGGDDSVISQIGIQLADGNDTCTLLPLNDDAQV